MSTVARAQGIFASRSFSLFYAGQALSYVGDGLRTLAIPLLVYHLTGSALSLGVTYGLEFLPFVLFGPVGGALADRLDRRRLMLLCDFVRFSVIAAFAIAYAAATGVVGIVFWFATAPDPRFGMGFLVAMPVLLLAWAAWRWLPEAGLAQRAWTGDTIAGLVFLFGIVVVAVFGVAAVARARSWPDIPVPTVQDAALGPRFHANVPVGTDQCWDAPLPCAPDFRSPSLRGSHVVIWRSIESGAADR